MITGKRCVELRKCKPVKRPLASLSAGCHFPLEPIRLNYGKGTLDCGVCVGGVIPPDSCLLSDNSQSLWKSSFPYSRRSRLPLITAWIKTKLSFLHSLFFWLLSLFFFFYLECERSKISRTTYRAWQCTPAFEVIRFQGRYKRTASIRLPRIEETQLNVALWREPTCHFPFVLSFEGKNSLPASILKSRSVKDFWFRRDILHYITASTWRARWNVSSAYPDPL